MVQLIWEGPGYEVWFDQETQTYEIGVQMDVTQLTPLVLMDLCATILMHLSSVLTEPTE